MMVIVYYVVTFTYKKKMNALTLQAYILAKSGPKNFKKYALNRASSNVG